MINKLKIREYKTKYFHFYPQWTRLHIIYNKWGYYDERPYINTNVTTLSFLLIFIIFGFSYITLFSLILLYYSWGNLYIYLPFKTGKMEAESPQYGVYNYGHNTVRDLDSFWIWFGKKNKVFYYPHTHDWFSTSVLMKDKTWLTKTYKDKNIDLLSDVIENNRYSFKESYQYITKRGEVQNTIATVKVKIMKWRRKFIFYLPIFEMTRKEIEVDFETGIGEGEKIKWGNRNFVYGCSYDMLENETPLQTLKRMEKNRKL